MSETTNIRNILSYNSWESFTGKEILDWARFNANNHTSHEKQAIWILNRYHDIEESAKYRIKMQEEHKGDPKTRKPFVFKVMFY